MVKDRELLASYLEGDLNAFEVFYDRHKDSLYTLLYNRVPSACEDLFQDMFKKFLLAIRKKLPLEPVSYLYRIAYNIINDYYRSRKPKPVSTDQIILSSEDITENEEKIYPEELIRAGLAELAREKPLFYEVIHLHLFGKFTFQQISNILACNINTIASRYRYGLRYLKEYLLSFEKRGKNDDRTNKD